MVKLMGVERVNGGERLRGGEGGEVVVGLKMLRPESVYLVWGSR